MTTPVPSRIDAAPDRAREVPVSLIAHAVAFDDIPRDAWDRLFRLTPAATPFSEWATHRAWWDAYAATAHAQYLTVTAPNAGANDRDAIRAIVPLMHRHEVEPDDAATHTALRRHHAEGRRVSPDAKAVFFGASYHADYATILADPADLDAVANATVAALAAPPDAEHGSEDWDVIDLRRLRARRPRPRRARGRRSAAAPPRRAGRSIASRRTSVRS